MGGVLALSFWGEDDGKERVKGRGMNGGGCGEHKSKRISMGNLRSKPDTAKEGIIVRLVTRFVA